MVVCFVVDGLLVILVVLAVLVVDVLVVVVELVVLLELLPPVVISSDAKSILILYLPISHNIRPLEQNIEFGLSRKSVPNTANVGEIPSYAGHIR